MGETEGDTATHLTLESSLTLVGRARAGDERALEILVARFLPRLRNWATGRLPIWARDLCSTDDIIQETLLATVRSIDRFEPRNEAALVVYLRQALLSRLLNEMRRARRRPVQVPVEAMEREPIADGSPLDDLIARQRRDAYEQALAQLSAEEREAVVGRLEMHYSYRELAEAWRKPSADAARKTVERALLRMAALMRPVAGGEPPL
jgi:RNA polymerase sigma factor (sigma-70 family)